MKSSKKRENTWIIGAYFGISMLISVIWIALTGKKGVDLAKERLHPGPGGTEGRSEIFLLYILPSALHYIIAALDIGKYHWSDNIPFRLRQIGLLLFTLSFAIIAWAEGVNPFFSFVIRIQKERGHHVITTGPYRYIRHPGYSAGSYSLLSSGLALGSWLSLLPALAFTIALIRRTVIEDRFLQEELEGYREYAEKVRYRLIPGVW